MQPSGGQNDSNFFVMHNGANSAGGTNNSAIQFRHPVHSDHSSLMHASDDMSVEWHTLFDHTASHGHVHGRGGDDWSSMADSALAGSNVGGVTDDGFDPKDLKKKVSDAQVYGPRFCVLYETFCHKNHITMDIRRHLMSLCLENLVPFVKWARENDTQIQWIQNTLLENDYLRPEVRNGVVIVLIYTFASIKASLDPNLDMFITLQDNDQGLGIANKFSLKIYNDPFFYLTFLKTTISALIDAGVLPDNERQNQPKRNKIAYQNREELQAFQRIQRMIVEALDSGNVVGAKALVSDVATFWQQRGKFVRNRRFAAALQVITQPRSALSPPGVADYTRPTTNNNNGSVYGSGSGSGGGAPLLSMGGGGNAASSALASVASDPSVVSSRGNDVHDSAGPSTSNSVAAALDPRRIDLAADEAVAAEEGEAASSGQKRPLSALRNVSHGDYSATRYASSMNDGADDDDEDDDDDLDDPDDPDQPPLAKRRASPSASAAPSSSAAAAAAAAVASIAQQQPPPPYYIQAHQQLRNLPDQVLSRAAAMPPIRPQPPLQPPLQQPLVADAQGFIPPSAVRTSFAPSSPLPSPRVGPLAAVGGLLIASPPAGPPIVWSVPALRMERIGSDRWLMKETRVFDVANFIDTVVRHQSAGSTATATATAGGKANALTTAGSIMLIQETTLATELASPLMELERRSAHPFGSGSVLEQELQLRGALVTSWPLDELAQFVSFLRAYQQHCRYVSDRWQQAQTAHGKATSTAGGAAVEDPRNDGELVSSSSSPHGQSADESAAAAAAATAAEVAVLPSLWEYWLHQGGRRGVSSSGGGGGEVARSVGYLVYEAPVQVVVLLRAQPTLSIPEDLWCTMYPHDFTALLADNAGHAGQAAGERRSETFGGLLIDLFPQLSHVGRDGAGASVANVTVRYLAHPSSSSTAAAPTNTAEGSGLPRKAPLAQYQTIGTWTHAAARLLVRLAPGPVVHDLLLECH